MRPILLLFAYCLFSPGTISADTPQALHHQGRIAVDNVNFDGTGQFRFQLYHSAASGTVTTPLWNNDDSAPTTDATPVAAVALPVTKGLYSAALGGTGQQPITASLVPPTGMSLFLRIWFDDGSHGVQQLSPDREIAAVPFARHAEAEIASGDLAISGDFKYAPPKTFTKYIPASACAPAIQFSNDDPSTFDPFGRLRTSSDNNDTEIVIPLDLPVGSTVQKVTIVGRGSTFSDLWLNRIQYASGTLNESRTQWPVTEWASVAASHTPPIGTVLTIEDDSSYNFYYRALSGAVIRCVILEYTTDLLTP